MTIFIDTQCHLFSDRSVTELWDFAKRLGLVQKWNHYSHGFPHFDLMGGKVYRSAQLGAEPLRSGKEEWCKVVDRMRSHVFHAQWHAEIAVWYDCTGLYGQPIRRLKIRETIRNELAG